MSEWKEYRLGDIIELIGGGTPKTNISNYWNGDIPWLSVVDFNNGRKYVFDTEKKITDEGLENSSTKLLDKGDIIISARGTVGVVAILGKPMAFNQSCYGIRALKKITFNNYVYYLLKKSISELSQFSHGGVFDTITRDTFKEIDIFLPPLPEQKTISSVLSSLDDKIELLHCQNTTLEKMAETLFRQWFIEEIKEEWEMKPLSLFGDVICGKTPSKSVKEYFGGEIPFIKIPDMHGKIFVFSTEDSLTHKGKESQSNKTIPPFSISVSCIATVGLVVLNAYESQTNQQINSIVPSRKEYRYYLYLYMKSLYSELHNMASGGTATLNLNTGDFSRIELLYPPVIILEEFHRQVEILFNKIFRNQQQIQILAKLRDTLLPKLITGKIRI